MRVFTSAGTTSICILLLAATLFGAGQVAAQQPSPDQIAAVKSNCRSDFMAKCRGVPRGGTEAFQCLKKNLASLSAPCQQAVRVAIAAAQSPERRPGCCKAGRCTGGADTAVGRCSPACCDPIFVASAQARHRSCDAAQRPSPRAHSSIPA